MPGAQLTEGIINSTSPISRSTPMEKGPGRFLLCCSPHLLSHLIHLYVAGSAAGFRPLPFPAILEDSATIARHLKPSCVLAAWGPSKLFNAQVSQALESSSIPLKVFHTSSAQTFQVSDRGGLVFKLSQSRLEVFCQVLCPRSSLKTNSRLEGPQLS
jgi:hypothetical protein